MVKLAKKKDDLSKAECKFSMEHQRLLKMMVIDNNSGHQLDGVQAVSILSPNASGS